MTWRDINKTNNNIVTIIINMYMITKWYKKIVQHMCTGASHGSSYSIKVLMRWNFLLSYSKELSKW